MKIIISIIIGLIAAFGVFFLSGMLINWIVSDFTSNDLKQTVKVILWVIGFFWITLIAVFVGWIMGNLIDILLDKRW
jgi:hypothetical protein